MISVLTKSVDFSLELIHFYFQDDPIELPVQINKSFDP